MIIWYWSVRTGNIHLQTCSFKDSVNHLCLLYNLAFLLLPLVKSHKTGITLIANNICTAPYSMQGLLTYSYLNFAKWTYYKDVSWCQCWVLEYSVTSVTDHAVALINSLTEGWDGNVLSVKPVSSEWCPDLSHWH